MQALYEQGEKMKSLPKHADPNKGYLSRCATARARLVQALNARRWDAERAGQAYRHYQALYDQQQTYKRAKATVNAIATRSSYMRALDAIPNAISPEAALGAYIANKQGYERSIATARVKTLTGKQYNPPANYNAQHITDQVERLMRLSAQKGN